MSSYDSNPDIVVIGGGISGLVAAYHIIRKEPTLHVIVLEAQGEIGGRLLSVPVAVSEKQMITYDLGGQWISSTQTHIMDLVKELDLELIPQYHDGIKVAEMRRGVTRTYNKDHPVIGSFLSMLEVKDFIAKIDALSNQDMIESTFSEAEASSLENLSMDQYIIRHLISVPARNLMKTIIKITCGSEASDISVFHYLAHCNSTLGCSSQYLCTDGGANEFWIKGGAQQICYKLATMINKKYILTNEIVDRIYNNERDVILKTKSNKVYQCSYAILAIPPKDILGIQFTPNLIEKQHNFQTKPNDSITKFVVTYREAFWRCKGYSGEILCFDGPVILAYDITIKNHAAIAGYATMKTTGDGTYQATPLKFRILLHLTKYLGNEAMYPINYIDKNWEYMSGSPMFCLGINNMLKYQSPKNSGRIYWAGSETATHWNGYMNGAVQSGYRAAIELLYDMRPQSISWGDLNYIEYDSCLMRYCLKNIRLINATELRYMSLNNFFGT